MSSIDGLPVLQPAQMVHPDLQGQTFQPMLLNAGEAGKSVSTSLDSVPMSLGPPTIISHPEYATASYMPAPSAPASKPRPFENAHRQSLQRSSAAAAPKQHRERTSSINSMSSITSNGVMSSITSTLGATNISFSDAPSAISTATAGASSLGTTVMGTGTGVQDDPPSPTTPKPKSGGHLRKAIAARVFECSYPGCTKAYTQLHNLKSHERTGHTPVQKPKPFHCIISGCPKAFSQRKSLALHIRSSHKEYKFKPFKCGQPGCQKAYTQLHNLRTHEKAVHMLDLSRKRIRNPLPNAGDLAGSEGQERDGVTDNGVGSQSLGRSQYTPDVEFGYDQNVKADPEFEDEESEAQNDEDYGDE
ncbi:hypothetical protein B0O80DRAFT_261738 [Mortierella sp. GBAus27b]|nr:hypothetical protein B0O80DRAFT_261738 [Mortierella sp. GBAus27b]